MKTEINLDDLVDIVSGKMTLKELTEEIRKLYLYRNPKYCIITIERDHKIKGMRGTIYITPEEFHKYNLSHTTYFL
jgi:hypothetical protein